MSKDREIADKLWKSIKSDRTVMLGLADVEEGGAQPMTAILEADEEGPVWFFSSKDVDLVRALGSGNEAYFHFPSKGHDVFAAVHGMLQPVEDRAVVERLWNPFIAAWYEGKDDPTLQLLRMDMNHAHIWLNENNLVAGVKMMLGSDPKKDYKDKVADVRM